MKFNRIATLNQRVERITTSTLVVGVDIAKERHVAQAVSFRGIVLSKRPIVFENTQVGFELFERSIRKLQQDHKMDDVIVGMESTGHYWFNLASWLTNKGIEVVLVNPATTKRNKENRDNTPSKSDPKDALIIADVVSRGYYTPYRPEEEMFQRLRIMMTNRERWTKQSARLKNQITRWLDIRFPEYTSVFKEIDCPRSLATLREFPSPSDLQGLTPQDVVDRWATHMSRPGGNRGLQKAAELIHKAKHSIGAVVGLEEDKWDLENLLDEFERVQEILRETERRIEKLLPEIPLAECLKSVGLTPTICAAVLAFGGDVSQLEHGNQLLRRAGLNLAEKTSGKYKGKIKLSKRGNSLLRKHLFLAVIHLVKGNEAFKAWHQHNVEQKRMSKMRSIMKLIGKLARILVAMCRKGETFSTETTPAMAA